jgi:capsular exopolysaccharide synthesis family protein
VVDRLAEEVQVEQVGAAYTVAISVTAYVPEKAARIANEIVASHIAERREAKRAEIAAAADYLNARLAELRDRATQSERAVADYLRQHGLAPQREDDPVLRQMEQLNMQLVLAETQRAQAEAKLRQGRSVLGASEKNLAVGLFTSPLLTELRQQAAQLDRRRAELRTSYGERHPQMQNLKAEIDSVRQREREEIARILHDLESDLAVAQAQEQQLRRHLGELEGAARKQQAVSVPRLELERQADADRAIYRDFLSRYRELSEQLDAVGAGLSVVSVAEPPTTRSFPSKGLLIGSGFAGSLMLGFVAAFIGEMLDQGLRSARQIQSTLGVPGLALVPSVSRRQLGRRQVHGYLAANPRSMLADAIRSLRFEIMRSNLDRPPKMLLVTSSLPGEGKTTLASALAVSAIEDNRRVVIVDLDLHRPRLRHLLGIPDHAPGLVELLAGECALEEALVEVPQLPFLHALTVRRGTQNPTALLTAGHFAGLLQRLRAEFDLVILDSPPTLALVDARALADLADAILFVARWGSTRAEAAQAGLERVRHGATPVVGVALNQVDVRRHAKLAYGDGLEYYTRYVHYYHD